MIRALLIAIALAALSVATRAQPALIITEIPAPPIAIPDVPTEKHCVLFVALTIQDGNKIEGPWSFGPIMHGTDPSYPSPIVVAEGAALTGPLTLTLCDGKLWISKP